MESFLKQFSTIPHDFIIDFYIISKEEYTDNDLVIEFEKVYKWLNVNKSDLKKVLIKHFELEYDYSIEKIKIKQINSNGANISEKILITPNCFKELCMVSNTKKAKEVRKYFIEMEKLIKKYYELIKEEMYKKIGILETNQKPKTTVKGGVIYILKALNSDITLYKLGKTEDLKKRLNTYNTGNANDIEPLFILPVNDIDNVETCIKKICKLYKYRKYKEVYEIDIDVLKNIMVECNDFVNKMNNYLENTIAKKDFKNKISRMKKKLDKYYIYISKD